MRWKDAKYGGWRVFVDWATRIHDGIYPSRSPSPAPKMHGCREPFDQCRNLAVYHAGQCTVPRFIPRGVTIDCPMRIADWKPGAKVQQSHEGRSPSVADEKASRILGWTRRALAETARCGPDELREIAAAFLRDKDHRTDIETLEALGRHMAGLYRRDRPWLLHE